MFPSKVAGHMLVSIEVNNFQEPNKQDFEIALDLPILKMGLLTADIDDRQDLRILDWTDNYFVVFAIALLHNTDFLENFKDWGFFFVLNLQGCFGDFNLNEGQGTKVNFFIFEDYFISPVSLIVSV
jgi:hypothetical protein